ncbi:ABC transporter permease [Natronorubrum halophilum]|uniref:ABC transporter permease n=1 Tax=Natronorubrum halophilum TaxID=1702106 RepID=UPI001EE952A6|nr:ABC transporter permease [Natronorubrum halophilum]
MSDTQSTADVDSEMHEGSNYQSFLKVFVRTVRNDQLALLGTVGLGITFFFAVLGPFVIPHDPTATNLDIMNQAPSLVHPFGTDRYGRDILARVALGARTSLTVAFVGVAVAAGIGVTLGAIAGYYEGVLGEGIMRFADTIFSFPALLLALAMVAILGQNWYNVIIAVGVVYWPIFARVTRGSVLSVKDEEFVQAARSIGESDFRIIGWEILPNVTAPIIVQGTISMAVAILLESALSFLGLGVPPPEPSWGRMLADSRQFMTHAPWWTIAPGLAIMFTVLNLNFMGDALRDALDPHQEEEMEASR